jgi:uncharacterized protein (TIGR02246 family)
MQSPRSALVLALLLPSCSPEASEGPLTAEGRKAVEAAVLALDDAWHEAATKSDAAGVLACFRDVPGFTFCYQGGIVRSLDAFRALTERSFHNRTTTVNECLERHVTVVDRDTAVVCGRSRFAASRENGEEMAGSTTWGFTATRVDGQWKVVHAYEFLTPE